MRGLTISDIHARDALANEQQKPFHLWTKEECEARLKGVRTKGYLTAKASMEKAVGALGTQLSAGGKTKHATFKRLALKLGLVKPRKDHQRVSSWHQPCTDWASAKLIAAGERYVGASYAELSAASKGVDRGRTVNRLEFDRALHHYVERTVNARPEMRRLDAREDAIRESYRAAESQLSRFTALERQLARRIAELTAAEEQRAVRKARRGPMRVPLARVVDIEKGLVVLKVK